MAISSISDIVTFPSTQSIHQLHKPKPKPKSPIPTHVSNPPVYGGTGYMGMNSMDHILSLISWGRGLSFGSFKPPEAPTINPAAFKTYSNLHPYTPPKGTKIDVTA